MTNRERVLALVHSEPAGLTDSEIRGRTGLQSHQQINQICRSLAQAGLIERRAGPQGRLVNFPPGSIPKSSPPGRRLEGRTSSGKPSHERSGAADAAEIPCLLISTTLFIIPCSGSRRQGGRRTAARGRHSSSSPSPQSQAQPRGASRYRQYPPISRVRRLIVIPHGVVGPLQISTITFAIHSNSPAWRQTPYDFPFPAPAQQCPFGQPGFAAPKQGRFDVHSYVTSPAHGCLGRAAECRLGISTNEVSVRSLFRENASTVVQRNHNRSTAARALGATACEGRGQVRG